MAFYELTKSVRITNSDPIDGDRYIAANIAARDTLVTTLRAHEGLQVYVEDTQTVYVLKGTTNSDWVEISDGTSNSLVGWEGITVTDNSISIGGGSAFTEDKVINTGAYDLGITGSMSIGGNLTVDGSVTYLNVVDLNVSDNIITINSGMTGTPPSTLNSGMKVDRGTGNPYFFIFSEATDTFRVGENSSETALPVGTQAVATREDAPGSASIPFWNNTSNRFDTASNFTFNTTTGLSIADKITGSGGMTLSGLAAATQTKALMTTADAGGVISTRTLGSNAFTSTAYQPAGTYNTQIGTDTDVNTSGAEVIDTITLTDGVIMSAITTRNLSYSDVGAQVAGTYNTIIGTDTDMTAATAKFINTLTLTDGVITNYSTDTMSAADVGAPTTTGTGASGSWGISITGNAATSTSSGSVTNALTAGVGISSAGTYNGSAARTFALDFSELTAGGTLVATDYLIAENGGAENRQLISSIPLSIFNNDLGGGAQYWNLSGTTLSPSENTWDVELSSIQIDDDAGAVVLVDMGVTATPTAGAEESYSFAIDGTIIAKVYAEANSSGGIQNEAFVVSKDLLLPSIPSATKTNVLYYDTGTDKVSYGAAPSGGGGDVQWAGGTYTPTNGVITANGDGSIVSEANMTFDGNVLEFDSAASKTIKMKDIASSDSTPQSLNILGAKGKGETYTVTSNTSPGPPSTWFYYNYDGFIGGNVLVRGGAGADVTGTGPVSPPKFYDYQGGTGGDLLLYGGTGGSGSTSSGLQGDVIIDGQNISLTSSSVQVSGILDVASSIRHIGNTTNTIAFGTNTQTFNATNIYMPGNYLDVGAYIRHASDADTYMLFSTNEISFGVGSAFNQKFSIKTTEVVVNEAGANVDFRVEGDTDTFCLLVDATKDMVGIKRNNPTATYALHVGGKIGADDDIIAYVSDIRLKTDIVQIENALDKISSIQGFTYRFNDLAKELNPNFKDESQVGMSAQDLQKILPEAVKAAPFDLDGEGSISGEDYLTIQYDKVVPLLVEGIKEQQTKIDSLEGKVDSLMDELSELKDLIKNKLS